jgi:hypothetical protein
MSAFVVGHDHINALLSWAIQKRVSYWVPDAQMRVDITMANASEVGRILLDENERSVGTRYNETDPDDMPGTDHETAANYEFRRWCANFSAVTILKACACFDYQACETDDYETTLAHRIIDTIRHHAISSLPGYDDAPGWSLDRARTYNRT